MMPYVLLKKGKVMKRYQKMSDEDLLEERKTMFEIAAFNRGQRAFAQKELRLILAEMLRRGL